MQQVHGVTNPDGEVPVTTSSKADLKFSLDEISENEAAPAWYAVEPDRVLAALQTDKNGLSAKEAARRLEVFGPNQLTSQKSTPWYVTLGRQFVSPMIGILLVCAIVTLLLQEWVDAGAIFFILLLNAALGFWQEGKAAKDVAALASLASPDAHVIRSGQEETIAASQLVPGDIVLLTSGDRAPADIRLIETSSLKIDESMLTGESEAASKSNEPVEEGAGVGDRTGMVYSGTLVEFGRGLGAVVGTGANTELGAINDLIQGPTRKTPLEVLTHSLEKRIGFIIAGASAVLFVVGLLLGDSASEMFLTVVALAVAVIPESLPIVLTVAMSVGVSRMVKRNALVRSLPAVETLGSTTVIGSDKTGTLTMNELTVTHGWTIDGEVDLAGTKSDPGQLTGLQRANLRVGALTNESSKDSEGVLRGDAADVAMARVALDLAVITDAERSVDPLVHQPYESELRMSQTIRDMDGVRVLFVKGSPDALTEASTSMASGFHGSEEKRGPSFSDIDTVPLDEAAIDAANDQLAAQGMRVLATAYRVLGDGEEVPEELDIPSDLVFLGLEGMLDPPRPGVAEAISACHGAGVRVIMITGDHPTTASAIAKQLNLDTTSEPLTGREIQTLSDAQLLQRLKEVGVAARVSPQDKMRIVEVLREDGETVAVTGDGVNDAPALKAASLGVAMGQTGTDVARDAADVVLTDDNFVTVVEAVRQGRITFNAIRKATYFLLTTGTASLIAVTLSVFADAPLIFLPLQMLFINVVTNGVQDIALAFEEAEGDELQRPPRSPNEGVLSATLWFRTATTGIWMALVTFGVFMWAVNGDLDIAHARTLALTVFVWMNFFLVQTARFENKSLFSNLFGNRILILTSIGALLLYWGAMSWTISADALGLVPLTPIEWLKCFLIGTSVLVLVEIDKLIRRKMTAGSQGARG